MVSTSLKNWISESHNPDLLCTYPALNHNYPILDHTGCPKLQRYLDNPVAGITSFRWTLKGPPTYR
jgi:hypothetical protein